MARRAVLIALAIASLAIGASIAGCQVPQRMPPVVIGPFDGAPSVETFERIVMLARAAGYQPVLADAETGVLRLRALSTVRGGEHGFVVQCFADGLVQIVPVGPRVSRRGSTFLVPPPLHTELVALADALSAARRERP